jgi:hypothetical protein
VNVNLLDILGKDIHVFKLLWSDVLSLSELEDVLCSVNNFNRTVLENLSYISRV